MSKESLTLVDSKRSWLILAVVFLSSFGVGGLQMSFGTILAALVQEFNESKSKTAWIGSLVTFFMCGLSPLTIFLSRRHGIKITQFIGGIFLTIGAITTSLVGSLDYMFLTYGVLIGTGAALTYSPVFTIIPDLFDKYVSIATSIGASSLTLGLIFFSFVLPTLLQELGWQKTLWILAVIGPLISMSGLAFSGLPLKQDCSDNNIKGKDTENAQPWWKIVKKKAFVLWLAVISMFGLVEFVPLYLIAICAQESGVPAYQAKWLNSIYGVGNFSGKLIAGLLAEPLLKRDQSKYLYLATLFTYTVSSFLVSLNTTFQWLASYMAVVGFLHGITVSLSYIVTLEIVGIAAYPAACGLILCLGAIFWTAGPPLAGLLYESLPHVRYLLLAISTTAFIATVIMTIIPCVTPRRTYTLQEGCYDYWRVYCRHPDVSPKLRRQPRAFIIQNPACELQSEHRQTQLRSLFDEELAHIVVQNHFANGEQPKSTDTRLAV